MHTHTQFATLQGSFWQATQSGAMNKNVFDLARGWGTRRKGGGLVTKKDGLPLGLNVQENCNLVSKDQGLSVILNPLQLTVGGKGECTPSRFVIYQ